MNSRTRKMILRADKWLKDIVTFENEMDMEACHIPYKFRKWNESPNMDPEWIYMLARQGYVAELTDAYKVTGNLKYLYKSKELIIRFIDDVGINDSNRQLYRTLDIGIRLTNWAYAIEIFEENRIISNEELTKVTASMKTQILYGLDHYRRKERLSNWGILFFSGVIVTGLKFPCILNELSKEMECAIAEFDKQMNLQFYSDGIHWEQSPMYHHEVIMAAVKVIDWAEKAGSDIGIPIREYLKKPMEASYYYCDNRYRLLSLHDSDMADFTDVYNYYSKMGLYRKTDSEIFHSLESGFMAYKNRDTYITMFGGRHGSSHGHSSLGSVTLEMDDMILIQDGGRFTYTENPIREYLKSEFMHNSVLLDQRNLLQMDGSWNYRNDIQPVSHRVQETKDFIVFENSWFGKCGNGDIAVFTRTMLYCKSLKIMLLFTNVAADGFHNIQTRYLMGPDISGNISGNHASLSYEGQEKFCFESSADNMVLHNTVYSPAYNRLMSTEQIICSSRFKDECLIIDVVCKADCITSKVEVMQCGTGNLAEVSKCTGIQVKKVMESSTLSEECNGMQVGKEEAVYYIYFCANDTFHGDKLYESCLSHSIYGKLTVYDRNNRMERIL